MKWSVTEAAHPGPLTHSQGPIDASCGRTFTLQSVAWRSDVVWMPMYFSVAVWLSFRRFHLSSRLSPRLASHQRQHFQAA
jgi:hypothetical protein